MTDIADDPAPSIASHAPRSLACLGDSGDRRTWSSTPYHFLQAGLRAGFLTNPLNLMEPRYARHRLGWSLLAPLRGERPGGGGYQYSRSAIRRMWECVPPDLRQGEIVSHFQLFPPLERSVPAGVRHSFYGDATLRQLFDAGGAGVGMGDRARAEVLRRETELYRGARFFIGMARATVESAVRDYGVDPARAFVVRPGANLDEEAVRSYLVARGASWREAGRPFSVDHPARLGFIGRDWKRKGLLRLVAAAESLDRRGRAVRVTVVGECPEPLRAHRLVEGAGSIDKARDTRRFLATVDDFALGCLPSYAEPLGISTLECLRLGVPVMGADVGGIPDCVPADAGFLVPVSATGETIADAIEHHVFDAARYDRLQRGAIARAPEMTWDRTVEQMVEIWAGRAMSYEALP